MSYIRKKLFSHNFHKLVLGCHDFSSFLQFSNYSLVCFKELNGELALVAHTCNPSYSGGRDQKDGGLKLAGANSLQNPISKKHITKKGLTEWLKQ
jgi:hypothetical protein